MSSSKFDSTSNETSPAAGETYMVASDGARRLPEQWKHFSATGPATSLPTGVLAALGLARVSTNLLAEAVIFLGVTTAKFVERHPDLRAELAELVVDPVIIELSVAEPAEAMERCEDKWPVNLATRSRLEALISGDVHPPEEPLTLSPDAVGTRGNLL